MQGELHFDFPLWFANTGSWNLVRPYSRPHTAFRANLKQVSRKPIADVNHGRCDVLRAQHLSNLNSRDGKEVLWEEAGVQFLLGPRIEHFECGGGTAQFPGHI